MVGGYQDLARKFVDQFHHSCINRRTEDHLSLVKQKPEKNLKAYVVASLTNDYRGRTVMKVWLSEPSSKGSEKGILVSSLGESLPNP